MKECKKIGCRNLTKGTYCEEHQQAFEERESRRAADRRRPTANSRGYSYRWQQYTKIFLRNHPLCAKCLDNGKLTAAVVVDHIKDHKGDKTLFWDDKNHQALCKQCHDRKTTETMHRGTTVRVGGR